MGLKNGNNIDIKLTGSQSFCGTLRHINVKIYQNVQLIAIRMLDMKPDFN
jgi:hypothetical protein